MHRCGRVWVRRDGWGEEGRGGREVGGEQVPALHCSGLQKMVRGCDRKEERKKEIRPEEVQEPRAPGARHWGLR